MGQVYTSPVSAEIKGAILALPLNDLARYGLVALQHLRHYNAMERLDLVSRWIVACACHPSVALDDVVVRVFRQIFESRTQRVSQLVEHKSSNLLHDAGTCHRGPFPGLTRALYEACRDRSPASVDNVCHVLRVFVQLAMDAAEAFHLYMDAWISVMDGISPLSSDQLAKIFEDGLSGSFASTVVANPLVLPLHVRRIFATTNCEGNIQLLQTQARKFVEVHDKHALHYLLYKWTLEAAKHPDTGLSHIIRPIVHEHFELPWLGSTLTVQDMETFRPRGTNYYTLRELESRIRRATIEFSSEVSLKPIEPRKNPRKLSNQVADAHPEGFCTVCQTEFEAGDEYVKLQGCNDALHLECLDRLINQAYPNVSAVVCPNCWAPICKPRDYVADYTAAA